MQRKTDQPPPDRRTYIGMIERSERNLSIDNIEKIGRALEVEPHRLLVDRR